MRVSIDIGVPIPKSRANGGGGPGRKPIYPFGTMEVGDSFAVPLTGEKYGRTGNDKTTQRVICAASVWKSRNGRDFTTRVEREHGVVRCWRVA